MASANCFGDSELDVMSLTDAELREQLLRLDADIGPISRFTRSVYQRKLQRLLRGGPRTVNGEQSEIEECQPQFDLSELKTAQNSGALEDHQQQQHSSTDISSQSNATAAVTGTTVMHSSSLQSVLTKEAAASLDAEGDDLVPLVSRKNQALPNTKDGNNAGRSVSASKSDTGGIAEKSDKKNVPKDSWVRDREDVGVTGASDRQVRAWKTAKTSSSTSSHSFFQDNSLVNTDGGIGTVDSDEPIVSSSSDRTGKDLVSKGKKSKAKSSHESDLPTVTQDDIDLVNRILTSAQPVSTFSTSFNHDSSTFTDVDEVPRNRFSSPFVSARPALDTYAEYADLTFTPERRTSATRASLDTSSAGTLSTGGRGQHVARNYNKLLLTGAFFLILVAIVCALAINYR